VYQLAIRSCKNEQIISLQLDHLTGMLRGLILRRLGLSGDEETINKCKEMFQAHLDETEPIPADLRTAVYWYVVLIMIYVIRNFE